MFYVTNPLSNHIIYQWKNCTTCMELVQKKIKNKKGIRGPTTNVIHYLVSTTVYRSGMIEYCFSFFLFAQFHLNRSSIESRGVYIKVIQKHWVGDLKLGT